MKNILFIVGVGRSGTSLLQSMVASHPQVYYLPETSFLRRMISRRYLHKIQQKCGEKSALNALEGDEYFARTKLDASSIVKDSLLSNEILDVAVYREMLSSIANKGNTWVGDKDPKVIEYLPLLKSVLPNTHVLHIYRDPRDVLVSKKKAAWSKSGHVWKHIFANRVQFKIGTIFGEKLFRRRYHEIRYEKLLSYPEKVLSELCEDLGLQYEKSMLSFGDAAKNLVAENEKSWKKETFGPLLTNNREKWKKELKPREIILTELCCRDIMNKGKYNKDNRNHKLGIKDSIWILMGRAIIIIASWPYIQYRNLSNKIVCSLIK